MPIKHSLTTALTKDVFESGINFQVWKFFRTFN